MIFSGFYKLQIQTTLHSFVSYEHVPGFSRKPPEKSSIVAMSPLAVVHGGGGVWRPDSGELARRQQGKGGGGARVG
jgi:hypothetical protein